MQEQKHQVEIDFHLYPTVTPQISYLHRYPFWCLLGQECCHSAQLLTFAILFLVCEEKSGVWHCTSFCGQTQARLCDLPVWHPVHFSSRKDRTCCCCDQDSGCLDIYPLSVKTPTTSLAHQQLLPPGTLAIPTPLCTCLD